MDGCLHADTVYQCSSIGGSAVPRQLAIDVVWTTQDVEPTKDSNCSLHGAQYRPS